MSIKCAAVVVVVADYGSEDITILADGLAFISTVSNMFELESSQTSARSEAKQTDSKHKVQCFSQGL